MRHALITAAAAFAMCGIPITACNDTAKRDQAPADQAAADKPGQACPAPASTADRDTKISATIHNQLEVDKGISSAGKMISVTTTNGIVVLDGVLHNEGDHQKLLSIVRKVDGVERIDDRIVMQ